jgi:hypothetical protein
MAASTKRNIASRRRKVRRWQGLEGQTRGSNGTLVGFLVLFQVAVVGLAFGGANAVHGRTCGGAGTSPAVDLQGLIRDPPGYQAVPIGTGGTGALTASDAANLFADPSKERQVLDCNGFQTGYLKAWNASNPNRGISVKLYEFSGANGATAFRNTDERSTAAAAGAVRKDFGGDTTVITPGVDRSGNYFGYDFATVGRIVAVVRMFRSDAAPSTDELHALMQDQQAQIGAGGSSA